VADEQKPDKAMAGMLKRKSAWPPVSAGEACPDAGILAAYFERSLTASETSQWETHFSSCARCQEQLAALVRSGPAPHVKSAEDKKPGFSWLWDWRLVAPVGAAVVVLAFFVSFNTRFAPIGSPSSGELAIAKHKAAPPATSAPQEPAASTPAKTDSAEETTLSAKSVSLPRQAKSRSKLDEAMGKNAAGAAQPAPVVQELKDKAPPIHGSVSGAVASRAEVKLDAREMPIVAAENRAVVAPSATPAASEVVQVEAETKQDQIAKAERAKAAAQDSAAPPPAPSAKKQMSSKKESPSVAQEPADSRYAFKADPQLGARLRAAPAEFIVNTPNSNVFWRFGASGLIERSRDAGKTWKSQESPSQESFLSASAPSESICWVGGSNGVLLRTTNGGEKWELIPSPAKVDIIVVKASDQLNVSVTAVGGRIYDTSDAGAHWRAR